MESTSLNTWGLSGINQSLIAVDVPLGAQFLSLVLVEDTQRNVHTDPGIGIDGRASSEVETEGCIGRAVRHGELVIGRRLVHRIHRGFQVEADIEGDLAHFIQGQQCLRELEQASYGELFDRRAIVQQREQVAMRRFQGIRDFNGQAQSSLGFKWSAGNLILQRYLSRNSIAMNGLPSCSPMS